MKNVNLKYDLTSGIVVFLVALPLCLGISLASGAPLYSGIISGIIGGIVVGIISTSQLSVSGPAAGLAALVLSSITALGSFELFLCAVIIAGLLQIIMSVARLGGIANYFPSSVIKGMLTSIGLLIIAKQIPHSVGYDKDEKGNLTELFPFGNEDWHELLLPFQHIEIGVAIICIVSLIILIVGNLPIIKKKISPFPIALIAVIIAVLMNVLFANFFPKLELSKDHLVNISIPESINDFFKMFTTPNFNGFLDSKVFVIGAMIAIIASLETLLCIEAVDNLDPKRRVTNTNRELMAQGIGNMFSGLIGGLPITSVIVRSSANIQAGGRTKNAAIFHGILLLVCVISIPQLLNKIPLAALSAILIITGFKLCNFTIFKEILNIGKTQYIPFFVTFFTIIGIDLFSIYKPLKGEGLLVGVILGVFVAGFVILHKNLKNSYYFHDENDNKNQTTKMVLSEEVSFLNKASIKEKLESIPAKSNIIIDATNCKYIDFDVLEIIKEFSTIKTKYKNINCELVGFKESYNIK